MLGAMAGAAVAGDRALIDFMGYSPDGRYFAFEEYGVQDGSGFAYSSVYVVDLSNDKWMYGSPFRAQGTDDADRPLAEVRAEARRKAEDQTKPLKIEVPAEILALLGDGVADADGKELRFGIPNWGPPGSVEKPGYTLRLETFAAKPGDPSCADYTPEPVKGYALTLTGENVDTELHRDTTIPKSRGCPLDYRLYAVLEPFQMTDGEGIKVAIISMYPFGFEGPDRRFLAVPLQ